MVTTDVVVSSEQPPIAVAIPFPSAPTDDEEAQATASAAQQEGISVIREHCEQHLSLNPNSSYVTWIATIHPENAAVSIDPRFLISGNPWLTVYNEAIEDLQKNQQRKVVPSKSKEVTPEPSAPPLDQDDHVAQQKKNILLSKLLAMPQNCCYLFPSKMLDMSTTINCLHSWQSIPSVGYSTTLCQYHHRGV
eukprot:988055_1